MVVFLIISRQNPWFGIVIIKDKQILKKSEDMSDTLKEAELFYPQIFIVIYIGLTTPAITCTAERSFQSKPGYNQIWLTRDSILYVTYTIRYVEQLYKLKDLQ